jgi:glycosyltransferase involved in cell wall biosynthesis
MYTLHISYGCAPRIEGLRGRFYRFIMDDARLKALEFPALLRGKRVLLATESFGPVNGVSRTTLNLVEYLRGNGVKVAVVAPEISTSSGPRVTSTTDNNGQIEVRLQGYPLPYNPELSVVYPVRLSALYARTFQDRPDLIYLASPASLGFQILLQLRQQQRSSRPPVLLNFQTDLSGYCEILFPYPFDAWAVWVFTSVQGYLFRHPSVRTVFYPSTFVRKYLEKAKIPPEKLLNLRRGVNAEMFHPSKRSEDMRKRLAPNGELILVSVARLAPEKGFEFLSEVAKQLDQKGFPFKLLIVGGNRNPQVEDEIRNMFGPLDEQGKVQFTGFLKGEELARAYAVGDIFLHCSITETFGLVVLESMASGVPVIARDKGGPGEIVAQNQSGYLVPPDDLEGFVEKVMALGSDCTLRSLMSIESRRMAEDATWEKINNQVAWKLAEALETQEIVPPVQSFSMPIYSWLLLSPQLRSFAAAVIVDARLLGGIGIIFGVWCGLVITWIFVQLALLVRTRMPWARDAFRGVENGVLV